MGWISPANMSRETRGRCFLNPGNREHQSKGGSKGIICSCSVLTEQSCASSSYDARLQENQSSDFPYGAAEHRSSLCLHQPRKLLAAVQLASASRGAGCGKSAFGTGQVPGHFREQSGRVL